MTCIAAVKVKDSIWVGGDSAGVSESALTIRKDSKVFRNGNFLIGFTSSFRMGQILRYKLKNPKHIESITPVEYLNTIWIDEVRNTFKTEGYSDITSNVESGGCFIGAYKGVLFSVHSDFQIAIPALDFEAVGSGGEIAKGSLYTQKVLNKNKDGKSMVKLALQSAEKMNAYVRKPFKIMKIKHD